MIQIDFDDISCLLKGNSKQRAANKVLTEILVFEQLLEIDPILLGSLPIDIEFESGNLEIACSFSDHDRFVWCVSYCFENYDSFQIDDISDRDGILLTSTADDFEIEIFAQ